MNKDNVCHNHANLKCQPESTLNKIYQTAIKMLYLQQTIQDKQDIDYWSEVAGTICAIRKENRR